MDALLCGFDRALRTLSGVYSSRRQSPAFSQDGLCETEDRRHAAALMRVNHSGEVCAQALYQSQALFAHSPHMRLVLEASAREEGDHLQWTAERICELGGRPSLLNPLFYAGAFAIGALAAKAGDSVSLGFLKETELQVAEHLSRHLKLLPEKDERSKEIIRQMRLDEKSHADTAANMGAPTFPAVVRLAMKASAKLMTVATYRV